MQSKHFIVEERPISREEYLELRNSTDWIQIGGAEAEKALSNDLYSICITHEGKTVGVARIIGDGAIYYYIQDLIVLPEYQEMGIGRLLMENIEKFLQSEAPKGAFIGLMAAENTTRFYENFGYMVRPEQKPGMFKYVE